ncbi:DUF2849 domain-containing protein [Azospirillaceae bacterium]
MTDSAAPPVAAEHMAAERKMVTANRLADGRTVWLAAGDRWVERVAEALPLTADTAEPALQRARLAERACLVVEPYLIDILGDRPEPARLRERIRAAGPTIGSPAESPARPSAPESAR